MISYFTKPDKPIKPEQLFGYGGRFLILKEAEARGLECRILVCLKKNKSKTLYFRFSKDKKSRWMSPQRGYFNSKLSCELALSKNLTYKVLQADGFPVPNFKKIKENFDIEKIDLNYPLVAKPVSQTKGRDVLIPLNNQADLKEACDYLFTKYQNILLEEAVLGNDYRLLILEDKMLAAVRRKAPQLVGDGKSAIEELIEKDNQNRRTDEPKEFGVFLRTLKPDEATQKYLREQKLTLESIPEKGQFVRLRQSTNFFTGGEVEDVTERVHPENIKIAVAAINALGLKMGGVDIITADIAKPIAEKTSIINEINGIPGIWIHHYPHQGEGRNVAGEILDYLFKN